MRGEQAAAAGATPIIELSTSSDAAYSVTLCRLPLTLKRVGAKASNRQGVNKPTEEMVLTPRPAILAAALLVVTASCEVETPFPPVTTTSVVTSPTTVPAQATTTAAAVSPIGTEIDEYSILYSETDTVGLRLDVLVAAADYTDRNLENFVIQLIEDVDGLIELNVFDDVLAADAFRIGSELRTEDQTLALQQHFLASLAEGNQLTFRGPFSPAGSMVVGS